MSLEQRTAKKVIERIRSDIEDQVEPFLWSDSDLLGYIDEAQQEFCNPEIGAPILDSKSIEICEIRYRAGDTELPVHPSIIMVLQAFRDDNDTTGRLFPLKIQTEADYLGSGYSTDDYGNGFSGHSFTQPGTVRAILIDYDSDSLRLSCPADADGIIRLRVMRGPKKNIEDCEDIYEIKRKYEPALVAWANHLAYLKQDGETFDPKAANTWETRFNRLAERANIEHTRRYSTPGTVQCKFP